MQDRGSLCSLHRFFCVMALSATLERLRVLQLDLAVLSQHSANWAEIAAGRLFGGLEEILL